MNGPEDDVGLTHRVLQEIFQIKNERSHGFQYTISINMLEIYLDSIRDLLASPNEAQKDFKVQDQGNRVEIVPALSELPCENEQAILNAIALGQRQRATSATSSNTSSSRSHSIVILRITAQDLHSDRTFSARMHLVDL